MCDKIDKYWNEFLKESGKKIKYKNVFYFGNSKEMAEKLLYLVINRYKTATSSSLKSYEIEKEELPKKGDYSIVTDWDGIPRCIIQITNINKIKFKDMTFDICKREGEDSNLESWKNNHKIFFELESKELGYNFDENMIVIFEDFNIVYITN